MVISSRLVASVLARNSNKKTARKLIRSILLETLKKRELMTTDLSNPLTTGLSQNGSIVDQYVGFGLPARPYSEEELKLNEGQHGIGL